MVHHRYVCHKFHQSSSPVQDKARAVIRKYKHQMKQLEFKRLQKLVPSMDEMEDPTEVSSLIFFLFVNKVITFSKFLFYLMD